MRKHQPELTRRYFLKTSVAAIGGVMIVPRYIVAGSGQTPPSERINIAGIGVGGRGGGDIRGLAPGNNITALCDVDADRAAETFKRYPAAKQYRDFRIMLDKMHKSIDAVVVATPDHCHAVASMAAIRCGKHVYCEKPLAHSIYEVRQLIQAAREHKVVTQMGNQGHSFGSIRDFCEWIWDGAIGKVHTIHAGCPFSNSGLDALPHVREKAAVPPSLDWDLWLGPAQKRSYHPAYVPAKWRGWFPFGNGSLGDWGCHVIDPVFWALELGAPTAIRAEVKDWNPETEGDACPNGEIVTYEFPATAKHGLITMKWFTGTEIVPRPPELEPDERDVGIGAAVYGDKGTIVYGGHGAAQVRIIPEAKMDAYRRPAKTLPRVRDHYVDWI
ncbi:MAG: Gfo/Idh/MocA family oxidoreductase, partial [Verrucomicrobiota bacterium]